MFKRIAKTLTTNLATSGTLKIGFVDRMTLADDGHRVFVDGTRYDSPTDFTIAVVNDKGDGVLTWLNATTITSGKTFLLGLATIDSITSGDVTGGGGGGGDSVTLLAGSALIGKVGIDQTTPGTTNGVVIKDSSGNAIDQTATVNVAQDSAAMKLGATSATPKFAAISSTGSGDTLALVSGKKIRVLSLFLLVAGATTVKFQSGATTDKTGAMSFPANGGISLPFNPIGHFETASGEKLNHVLGSSVGIAGGFTYIEV